MFTVNKTHVTPDDAFITKILDTKAEELRFDWKDDNEQLVKNFKNLKTVVESKQKKSCVCNECRHV